MTPQHAEADCSPTSAPPMHASPSSACRGAWQHVAVLPCADYPGFTAVVQAYLDSLPPASIRATARWAIANPIEGDWVRMTNRDWAFSIQEAQRQLDLTTLLVVNNFTALAMSLPRLGAEGATRSAAASRRATA